MLSNASCNCGAPCENSHHFFFDCDKYTDNREILFDSLNWLPSIITIDIKLLTKGGDFLTYQENSTIFLHAFKYIKDSKRFTNCLNDLKNQQTSPKLFILLFFRILSLPILLYIIILCLFISMHIIYISYHCIAHANTYCK